MANNTVSASVAIKKDRQNNYATLAIDVQGSLSQFYNAQTKEVTPNWGDGTTATANSPVLTPNISCSTEYTVSGYTWLRDGVVVATGTSVVSGYEKVYKFDGNTGALTIIANLASPTNTDPDTFTCQAAIIVDNITYNMERSISAAILPMSSSGYALVITASEGTALSSSNETTELTATVYNGKGDVVTDLTDFSFKWFKGSTQECTTQTYKISREDVSWEQVFRCVLYKGSGDNASELAIATTIITDQADNYMLSAKCSGNVTSDTPATISGQLFQRSGTEWVKFSKAASYDAVLFDNSDTDKQTVSSGTLSESGAYSFEVSESMMNATGNGIESGNIEITAYWD